MGKYIYILFLVLSASTLMAQSSETIKENIVPNPSFEKYSASPIGWFYKGKHFSSVMKYWSSATSASPDVFGPKVRVPAQWAEKGFGEQSAHTGSSMSGITVYGCEQGKPHCREYIQIQLSEPLVPHQNYYIEFWVSSLDRSLQVNNIGAYFSKNKIEETTDKMLEFEPQVNITNIIRTSPRNWTKISGKFRADAEASYLLIGNFYPDTKTQTRESCCDPLNFGYYYIDDILLRKEEPYLNVPLKEDDLTRISINTGSVITLKDIYFDTAKAELLPRSNIELNKLVQLLQSNPSMIIEVRGHTDNQGNPSYNQTLSENRAQSVVQFLNQNGINPHRTQFRGFGQSKPISDNETQEGRQLNRRVEFMVVQK